jgi:hypothetical protein
MKSYTLLLIANLSILGLFAQKTEINIKHNRGDIVRKKVVYNNYSKSYNYNKDENYYGVPNIEILNYEANYSKNKDTINHLLEFKNSSNITAYHFNYSMYLVGLTKGLYVIYGKSRFYIDETISGNNGLVFQPVNRVDVVYDTIYLYIQSTYSNYYKKVNKTYDRLIEWNFKTKKWGYTEMARKTKIISMINEPVKKSK